MSEPGAIEQRPVAPAAADPVPENLAERTARNIERGMERGRRQQDLEKAGLVFEKVPKSVFLGMAPEQRKAKFIELSGNAQDYLLEQFDEQETATFWGQFEEDEATALKRLQKMRKDMNEAFDPENGRSLGDRQEIVAPGIDEEGKEFVHNLDKLLDEGRTTNGGLNNIDVVKPLLAVDGMTKKDAIAMLKSRDITDPATLAALTADLVADFDELITQGRTQTGGLSNIDAVKPLLAGMTKKEAIQLLSDKNITNPATLAALTADLKDGDASTIEEKNEELQQTNEVMKRQMLEADERLEKEKEEHPERAEEINAMQRKLRNFSTMFGGFFAEGEPGRDIVRKGKKWLYYLLVTAIVLLLMECNLIYKAAAGRKGR